MCKLTKNKVKLSLIDDYIKIVLINNFFQNDILLNDLSLEGKVTEIKQLNNRIKLIYEQLFDILKLNDTSLMILKNDLKQNNQMFTLETNSGFNHTPKIVEKAYNDLIDISQNLNEKLKVLRVKLA